MTMPLKLRYFTGSSVELTAAEQSLYGTMDIVRQATNAGIRRFVAAHRELLTRRVLDYGAGKPGTCRIPQPFRELIGAAEYVPWEPGDNEPSGNFTGILCTQVAQNLEDPFVTFSRFRGLLFPGGHLVLTYPVAWEPIENEFWRFTPKGIWLLCHKSGLKIIADEMLAEVELDGSLRLPMVAGIVAKRA